MEEQAPPAGSMILNRDNPDGFNQMPKWQQMQYKSFRAWLMYNLGDGKPITSLTQALHDGSRLVRLIEKISGQKLQGIEKRPRLRIHIINNVGQVFTFLRAVPIVINNISPEDIVDGNVKLTLGFLWLLILHYQIKNAGVLPTPTETPEPEDEPTKELKSDEIDEELELKRLGRVGKTAKQPEKKVAPVVSPAKPATKQHEDPKVVLVEKVNDFLEIHSLPFKVTNFTDEWQDGMRFGALIHARDERFPPNWEEFKPENARENLQACFDIFKNEFGLPEILSVEDLVEQKPDEKSVMTFVAMIFHAFSVYDKNDAKPKVEEPPPQPAAVKELTPPPSPKKEPTPPPSPRKEPTPPPSPKKEPTPPPSPKKEPTPPPSPKKEATPPPSPKKEKPKKKKKAKKPKVPKEPPGEKVSLRVCAARRLKSANDKEDDSGYPDTFVELGPVREDAKKKHVTETVEKTLHPEWNEEFEFEKGELKLEDALELRVRSKGGKKDLGVVHVPVKDIADATERDKVFDEWLPLLDSKTKERVDGDLRIVATYGDVPLPEPTKYLPIRVRIAQGRELLCVDSEDLSDPYCVIEVPGLKLKKSRTKTVEKTLEPEWDDEFFFDSGVVDAVEDVLRVKVFSDRGKEQVSLGVVEFPFKKVLETPFMDDWFPVMRADKPSKPSSGDIRMIITYGRDLPPILSKVFVIAVLAARNLAGGNKNGSSDPYVQIWVPGKKAKRLVLKTKTKRGTVNPVWNQEFEFEMEDFDKEKDVIEFHIFDRDFIGENKPLGIVELQLKDIIKVPYIDSWFTVYDRKHRSKKGVGEVHLRIAFGKVDRKRLEEAFEGESRPSTIGPPATNFRISKDIEEKKKVKKRDKRFHAAKGLPIRIRVVAASMLKGSPDPYVLIEIPGKKTTQKLKTKALKKTSNPVWNEEFHMSGEPLDADDRIRFCVHTSDVMGSSLLGLADVEVKDVIDSDDGILAKALTLCNSKNEEDKSRGTLHVLIAYGDSRLPEVQVTGDSPRARNRSGSLPVVTKNIGKKNSVSADDVELEGSGKKKVHKRKNTGEK